MASSSHTQLESDVLRLIVQGRTNRQIAAQLRVSADVVERTIAAVTAKIGAGRVEEAT